MFIPTANEKKIIKYLLENNSGLTLSDVAERFPNMENAIEGCLTKGFIEQTTDGMCKLTELGKNAI